MIAAAPRYASRTYVALCALVVGLALAVGLKLYADHTASAIRAGQLVGCERGKLDRAANARAFRAQSDYLNLVIDAKSVKEDVKRAARKNQRIQDGSATSLESRSGPRLICVEVYPKP